MAGLEVLYHSVRHDITTPQDAIVCFVHWELLQADFRCLGIGDRSTTTDVKSELLPENWNSSKELYTLRYQSDDEKNEILIKAVLVDTSLIINMLTSRSEQVANLTINLTEHIDIEHLQDFGRVYKNMAQLKNLVKLVVQPTVSKRADSTGSSRKTRRKSSGSQFDQDAHPSSARGSPRNSDPIRSDNPNPFAAGGADLDPFGGCEGGMIVDPLHSGFPKGGFDPAQGTQGGLPPGSVPPGARFDPFAPIGRNRPGPDPDHLPPPGYEDNI
ncbi:proteasome inhibitor PI31 subunit-like [Polypterus senegalus]